MGRCYQTIMIIKSKNGNNLTNQDKDMKKFLLIYAFNVIRHDLCLVIYEVAIF